MMQVANRFAALGWELVILGTPGLKGLCENSDIVANSIPSGTRIRNLTKEHGEMSHFCHAFLEEAPNVDLLVFDETYRFPAFWAKYHGAASIGLFAGLPVSAPHYFPTDIPMRTGISRTKLLIKRFSAASKRALWEEKWRSRPYEMKLSNSIPRQSRGL